MRQDPLHVAHVEDARAVHDFHVAALDAERLCGPEDADGRIACGNETGGNPTNVYKHFSPLCLGILILGITASGTPAPAVATGAHVGEMAATAGTPVRAPDTSEHGDETALTSMAVIAVDDHWSVAELRGNTAWLRSLLLADYRSVRADGNVWDRKILLAHAAKNRGHGQEKLKGFDAWLRTHPMDESVTIHGHVAVLSFSNPETGHVRLSNIFVYEKGRWRALYSQLTKAGQACRKHRKQDYKNDQPAI